MFLRGLYECHSSAFLRIKALTQQVWLKLWCKNMKKKEKKTVFVNFKQEQCTQRPRLKCAILHVIFCFLYSQQKSPEAQAVMVFCFSCFLTATTKIHPIFVWLELDRGLHHHVSFVSHLLDSYFRVFDHIARFASADDTYSVAIELQMFQTFYSKNFQDFMLLYMSSCYSDKQFELKLLLS